MTLPKARHIESHHRQRFGYHECVELEAALQLINTFLYYVEFLEMVCLQASICISLQLQGNHLNLWIELAT
jgi:hypothetical protein